MEPDQRADLEARLADLKQRLWPAYNAAGWGDISWGEAKALRFELERLERELERDEQHELETVSGVKDGT